jgi:methyltransferase (TIGR00027 family)
MESDRASRTAEYMAFFRALEAARPPGRRRLEDPYAVHFLSPGLRRAVALSRTPVLGSLVARYADRRLPGARTSAVARTRVIDEVLAGFLAGGVDQVVLLGAGYDCRGYRMPGIAAATVFEVEHPATLAAKRARLREAAASVPAHVRFVETDFNRCGLAEGLAGMGFDRRRPAAFVWEGVTNYLTREAVEAVLGFVGGCARASRLVFTYVHRGALDGSVRFEDAPGLLRSVAALGEPWTFGLDPAESASLLRRHGLVLEADWGAREYRARVFGPSASRMRGYDFYRLAVAAVPDA